MVVVAVTRDSNAHGVAVQNAQNGHAQAMGQLQVAQATAAAQRVANVHAVIGQANTAPRLRVVQMGAIGTPDYLQLGLLAADGTDFNRQDIVEGVRGADGQVHVRRYIPAAPTYVQQAVPSPLLLVQGQPGSKSKGKRGPAGPAGLQGPQGAQGPAGPAGAAGGAGAAAGARPQQGAAGAAGGAVAAAGAAAGANPQQAFLNAAGVDRSRAVGITGLDFGTTAQALVVHIRAACDLQGNQITNTALMPGRGQQPCGGAAAIEFADTATRDAAVTTLSAAPNNTLGGRQFTVVAL